VGVFAKVVLAIAILVANGVLLFVVLRFLLWLAFPGSSAGAEATAARAIPATGAAALTADAGAEVASATAEAWPPPAPQVPAAPGALPVFAPLTGPRPRAYPHRLLIGLPVILALFAGGVWLGSVVGGSGSAAAATKVVRVTGKVITVNHTAVVRVPAQTVHVKGSVVSVPATTVQLPPQILTNVIRTTHTTTVRLPGRTRTDTTTIAIPTTITEPGTTLTLTETTTETVTTTDTNSTSTTT
jgi:hypothetical protein